MDGINCRDRTELDLLFQPNSLVLVVRVIEDRQDALFIHKRHVDVLAAQGVLTVNGECVLPFL